MGTCTRLGTQSQLRSQESLLGFPFRFSANWSPTSTSRYTRLHTAPTHTTLHTHTYTRKHTHLRARTLGLLPVFTELADFIAHVALTLGPAQHGSHVAICIVGWRPNPWGAASRHPTHHRERQSRHCGQRGRLTARRVKPIAAVHSVVRVAQWRLHSRVREERPGSIGAAAAP